MVRSASWAAAAAMLALAGPAGAQAPALPETSRAQQQVDQLSRLIDAQQRSLQQSQQNQFELNQLRGDIQRQNAAPPPPPVIVCGRGARC